MAVTLVAEAPAEQLGVSTAGSAVPWGLLMNAPVSNQPAHAHSTPLTRSSLVPLQGARGTAALHHERRA